LGEDSPFLERLMIIRDLEKSGTFQVVSLMLSLRLRCISKLQQLPLFHLLRNVGIVMMTGRFHWSERSFIFFQK
jgi:hypothetical protein